MAPTKATKETVLYAYQQLVAENTPPSAEAIIGIIGGSKSTVLRHLNQIRVELAAPDPDTEPLPAFLYETAEPMIRQLWSAAQREASKASERKLSQLFMLQAGLIEDVQTAEKVEEMLSHRLSDLELENASLKSSLEQIEAEAANRAKTLEEQNARSATLQIDLERAKTTIAELRSHALNIDRLEELIRSNGRKADSAKKDAGSSSGT